MKKSIKILCIGNSFSHDTTRFVPQIALSCGYDEIVIANLYIGGCPIQKHLETLKEDLPLYRFERDDGSGWSQTPEYKSRDAILSENWDWISIQHGSSYGGFYTKEESYKDLPELVERVRSLTGPCTKIAFNMTWVGEPWKDRPEMIEFERDQLRYFEAICHLTKTLVAKTDGIDLIVPTGTAIQNARTTDLGLKMNRDGFHLSLECGRYLAGLTFFCFLTETDPEKVEWKPEEIGEEEYKILQRAAKLATTIPYSVTEIL